MNEKRILKALRRGDSAALEKIAKNLEIRETDNPVPQGNSLDEIQIGMMDIGRG